MALLHWRWRGKREVHSRDDVFEGLPQGTRDALQRLWAYQIPDDVLYKLRGRFPFDKMSEAEIGVSIIEFKKFMALLLINRFHKKRTGMTSSIVDEVWHTLILFTKEYHKFSKMLVGNYIHHTPNTPHNRLDPSSAQNFYAAYYRYFGELAPIWGYEVRESTSSRSSESTVTYELIRMKPQAKEVTDGIPKSHTTGDRATFMRGR